MLCCCDMPLNVPFERLVSIYLGIQASQIGRIWNYHSWQYVLNLRWPGIMGNKAIYKLYYAIKITDQVTKIHYEVAFSSIYGTTCVREKCVSAQVELNCRSVGLEYTPFTLAHLVHLSYYEKVYALRLVLHLLYAWFKYVSVYLFVLLRLCDMKQIDIYTTFEKCSFSVYLKVITHVWNTHALYTT